MASDLHVGHHLRTSQNVPQRSIDVSFARIFCQHALVKGRLFLVPTPIPVIPRESKFHQVRLSYLL